MLDTIIDGTTKKRARQISITPAAHKRLDSLTSELGMKPRVVASVILCHYCSLKGFRETLDDPGPFGGLIDKTTDELARQVRITPAGS